MQQCGAIWCGLAGPLARLDLPPSHRPALHQIRITNPTFSRHVRDAPGGEEFMHAAGWAVKVRRRPRSSPPAPLAPAASPPAGPACHAPSQCRLAPHPPTHSPAPPHPQVEEHEKYFVFTHQPGSLEWRVLGEAVAELAKLAALLDGKIKVGRARVLPRGRPRVCMHAWYEDVRWVPKAPCVVSAPLPRLQRGQGDRKAAQERMRQEVLAAIHEDAQQREVMYQVGGCRVGGWLGWEIRVGANGRRETTEQPPTPPAPAPAAGHRPRSGPAIAALATVTHGAAAAAGRADLEGTPVL